MNFWLARDQVVLLETAGNLWASRRKANDFCVVFFSSVEMGGITKHLLTGPAGNSTLVLWPQCSLGFAYFSILVEFSLFLLRPWQTRTHCCGHIVADTLLPTQMFPRLPARATFVADTNFVSGTQKCVWFCSETFCVRKKCFPVCAAQETSWETIFPQQCVLVYQGLNPHTSQKIGVWATSFEYSINSEKTMWVYILAIEYWKSKMRVVDLTFLHDTILKIEIVWRAPTSVFL